MKMLSLPHLLEQACGPEGLDITQTVDEFLHGLSFGCYICQRTHDFSERYQEHKFSNTFHHLEPGKQLFKNVKCRKIERSEIQTVSGVEIPKEFHFDTIEIMLGSHDAAESFDFDIQVYSGN